MTVREAMKALSKMDPRFYLIAQTGENSRDDPSFAEITGFSLVDEDMVKDIQEGLGYDEKVDFVCISTDEK